MTARKEILRKQRETEEAGLRGREARLPPVRGRGRKRNTWILIPPERGQLQKGPSDPCDILGEKLQHRILLRMRDAQSVWPQSRHTLPQTHGCAEMMFIKHSVKCLARNKSSLKRYSYNHYRFAFTEATCPG